MTIRVETIEDETWLKLRSASGIECQEPVL
jgi:hypothetical protein